MLCSLPQNRNIMSKFTVRIPSWNWLDEDKKNLKGVSSCWREPSEYKVQIKQSDTDLGSLKCYKV